MQEDAYNNRELDSKFANVAQLMVSNHELLSQRMETFETNTASTLNRIEEQTKKTNGSVANLKTWRTYTVGFIAGLALAFGILAFFVGQVFVPIAGSFIQNGNKL